MSRPFHKPVRRPSDVIDTYVGSGDPAEITAAAHDTAAALLHRVRECRDPEAAERVIAYADAHGIDDVAELWASSDPVTLPGALWRLYLIRHTVAADPAEAAYLFGRGLSLSEVDRAIVGAAEAPTPEEMTRLANEILRGAFEGDFALALERAAAFCRVMSLGSADLVSPDETTRSARGEEARSARYSAMADELTSFARVWRAAR